MMPEPGVAETRPWWRSALDPYLWGYLAVYGLTLWLLQGHGDKDDDSLFALVLFAGILPGIALLLTRNSRPLDAPVRKPAMETALLLGYLALAFVYLIWGVGPLKSAVPKEPAQDIVLLVAKLVVWVALPALLLRAAAGYSARELAPVSGRRRDMLAALVLGALLILLQLVVGRGLKDMKESGYSWATLAVGAPLVFAWLVVEVGIVEEFFFRALLQTRIARLLRSETAGIAIAALLFGLVHAPGFYLRTAATQENLGAHPSVFLAAGYAIVVTSTAGIFMGVLWSRTRNFAAVVLVHAAGDLAPNLVPMLQAFLGK